MTEQPFCQGARVRKGKRVGTVIAVYVYTAVVQWDGKKQRDVVWLEQLGVVNARVAIPGK